MDATQWKRLEALFIAALELEPADRAAFLDEACADDLELRNELESMLSTDEESIALALESRLLTQDDPTLPGSDALIGTHIGPYRIEKLIGEGGMGEVYLAMRDDDQFEQKVALKLVRPGYRSSQMLARFRMERQVLARLTHPNITQLLDGGIDQDGRPYLVMQYVEGISITKFCDKHALSIEERLNLFRTVCSAVQHAHRNLVVHRDLKPSNILVTEEGTVKLLDFGIAKLLDPEWDITMAVTQSQFRLMTPEYAAPEQVRGATITTATDVYALGVLLYELLCGRRPYSLSNRMQAEIERIVCDVTPTRPSTAISEADPARASITAETISKARRTGVSRLKKALQGDLDNIVLMALRKEPERRYASPDQFAEDIARYLSGRPVRAEKDRMAYRFKKFVYRNRRLVTVAAAALLLILGFSVIMTVQAIRISNQADVLAQERDRAQLEADKANQVAGFLEDLFKASDPFQDTPERRDTLRVRDFLAIGAQNVEKDLADQPEIQAALFDVLGRVHRNLGDFKSAQTLTEKGLDIRKNIYPTAHTDLAESMSEMGALYRDQGDFKSAEPLLEGSLQMLKSLHGNDHPFVADGLTSLGSLRQAQGEYALAESLYTEALQIDQRAAVEEITIAADLNNIAAIHLMQGRFDEADSLFKIVLDIRQRVLGPRHPNVVETLNNRAFVLQKSEHFDEAESMFRTALEINREIFDDKHPRVVDATMNLGLLLKTAGKLDEAETLYREGLALHGEIYGNSHPNIATDLHNLGALLKAKEDYAGAAVAYEEALTLKRQLLGDMHPSTAATINNLGVLYKSESNYARAEPLLREALAINRKLLEAGHPRIGLTLDSLGDLLYKTKRYKEADAVFQEALEIFIDKFGPEHTYTKRAQASLDMVREAY